MKHSSRQNHFLTGLILALFMTAAFSVSAFAAKTPSKPKSLKAETTEKTVTLTWKASTNANGYMIYMKKWVSGGEYKKIARVKNVNITTFEKKKMVTGRTYSFYVQAYRRKNGKILLSKRSRVVKVTLKPDKPANLENLLGMSRSKTAVLVWNKSDKATEYLVQQKINGKWKKVLTTSKLTATIGDLETGSTYKFRVRPLRTKKGITTTGYGAIVNVKVESLKTQVERLVTRDVYEVQMTRTVTVRKLDGSGTVTLTAGSTLGAVWKNYNYGDAHNDHIVEYFVTRDGVMVEGVQDACVPLEDLNWNHSKPYSSLVAEYYVNKTYPQTSKTNWMLWVNYYTQYIYAFKRKNASSDWEWYATWETSTGKYGMTQTPRGRLEIVKKSVRYYFPGGGGAFGMWASHLTGEGNAIHGPRRFANGAYIDPGVIGYPLSAGCCRLFDVYAKFVYDNMPIGTRVLVA